MVISFRYFHFISGQDVSQQPPLDGAGELFHAAVLLVGWYVVDRSGDGHLMAPFAGRGWWQYRARLAKEERMRRCH
jgi:hypothetical protein